MKTLLERKWLDDDLGAIGRLAELGSSSATVLVHFGLTRAEVAEAILPLRGRRNLWVNLASIQAASRYTVLTRGKLYHVKCPQTYRLERDSFGRLIECYHLVPEVQRGAEAPQSLVRMARITVLPLGLRRIPYLVEYER